MEFFGVGVEGVGACVDEEVAQHVDHEESDEEEARDGDDDLFADGGLVEADERGDERRHRVMDLSRDTVEESRKMN